MPLFRYFVCIGGLLLGIFFVIDVYGEKRPSIERADIDRTTIRINSVTPLLTRVLIDTSLPTIVPPPSLTIPAQTEFPHRETFAAIQPVPVQASATQKPVSVARRQSHQRVAVVPSERLMSPNTPW